MRVAIAARKSIYKAIFGRLLRRFGAVETRVDALESSRADESRELADVRVQIEQLSSLLALKGLVPPIPPGHLQLRVAGYYSALFFMQGADLLNDIERLLAAQGRRIDSFERVLDFGCGCGRILIPLMLRMDASRLFGCDIDPEAITWCQTKLTTCAGFRLNGPMPPMDFHDGQFDLIYGVSVFTHLPEEMQIKWLDDLFRVTKPGGYVLLTFHGEPHFAAIRSRDRKKLDAHGFYYTNKKEGSTLGLPNFYQTSWHTHPYVRKHWGAKFEMVDIVESGIANHDVAVLRKRA